MLPVRSVLVDFDGTACLHDVAEHLMDRFGDPDWRDLGRDVGSEERSTRGPRSAGRSRRSPPVRAS